MPARRDRTPLRAVLFDFQGTVAQVEEPTTTIALAAAACGAKLDAGDSARLTEALIGAGWLGSGVPPRVPPHLTQLWLVRDLSETDHRAAFTGLAETAFASQVEKLGGLPVGFAEAIYERLISPDGWCAYPDTVYTLQRLGDQGIPIALVSNIGFDVRPVAKALGFARFIDAWVLSFEVGIRKPDPEIFRIACSRLHVDPAETLMVGDSGDDAGAIAAGCPVFLFPHSAPGRPRGLDVILDVIGNSA